MYNELYHHGVKGQRWGVRRYQNKDGSLTKYGRERLYGNKRNTKTKVNKKSRVSGKEQVDNKNISRTKTIDDYIKAGKIHVDNLKDYNVGSLTTFSTNDGRSWVSGLISPQDFDFEEVTNITDVGYVPVAERAKTIFEESGHYGVYAFNGKDPIYERSVNHGRVDDYVLNQCNPEFGASGTTQNCAKCSATLELGARGFNFQAGRQSYPSSVDAESLWFKGAKRVHMDTDITEESIKSYGKKTSGTISIRYPNNAGGHAMHWTVDDDGKFEIQDGQNGRRFNSLSDMMNTYGASKDAGLDVFRLDNCEPNWDMLAQDSVIRDPGGSHKKYNSVRNKFDGRVYDTW